MQLSIIELLQEESIITLVECSESQKDNNGSVIKIEKDGKCYMVSETLDEIKLEILVKYLVYISTIKSILVALLVIFIFFAFIMLCSLIR